MAQNRSSAVMQQRSEAHDSLDDFPTPPWATRAMIEHVVRPVLGARIGEAYPRAWEPACNRGYMARPLGEYFGEVVATDIHDYGFEGHQATCDFLMRGTEPDEIAKRGIDWIFTNPPYVLGEDFYERCMQLQPRLGFGFILRSAWLEGEERWRKIFNVNPPTIYAQFCERVVMMKGILRDPDVKYWCAKERKWKKPSSATAYCWLLWIPSLAPKPTMWIPPCRRAMTRPGDYPEPPPPPADAMPLFAGAAE